MSKIPSIVLQPSGYGVSEVNCALPTNGDADLIFSRASSARRVKDNKLIEVVGSNIPRLNYLHTSCPSLLIEEESENIALRSNEFLDAVYVKSQVTVTANDTTSPTGEVNASKLTENTVLGVAHTVRQDITSSSTNEYAFSVFAKPDGRDFIYMFVGGAGQGVIFDITNGALGSDVGSAVNDAYAINYGNGWYRCTIVVTGIVGTLGATVGLALNSSTFSYTGDGVSGAYLYGAQLEEKNYSTTYIETLASAVPRNADSFVKTGLSSLVNSNEGTIFLQSKAFRNTGVNRFLSISDNTANNRIDFGYSSIDDLFFVSTNANGSSLISLQYTLPDVTQYSKFAITWDGSFNFKLFVDGSERDSDTGTDIFVGLSQIKSENPSGTIRPFNGEIKDFRIYKSRLNVTDAENLTA